jgi:exopolyphosphatase / guanosine-5'-triphosphate,3'-diphosphate pyrophosphatase
MADVEPSRANIGRNDSRSRGNPRQNGPSFRGHDSAQRSTFRPNFAAIDLGTNNCRLLIARPQEEGFIILDAFSRIVRLGEGLNASGRLSDAAIDRAVAALSICADKLSRRNVTLARSVATEACRRASNGREFVDRVRSETGIYFDIISPAEEARLAVLGCHALLEPGRGPALIFDIGGGSTELILIDPDRPSHDNSPAILDWCSIPWGVVSLTEEAGAEATYGHDAVTDDRRAAYAQMQALVAEAIAPFADRIHVANVPTGRLLGTSGTVTTLASRYLNLPHYDRQAVDGLIVPSEDMRAICTELAAMSEAEREATPCIGRERGDLVVAGCAILEAILDIWPAERLGVADRGIREGILRSLMARHANGRRR